MKKILIIGGNGNIGFALAEECLRTGYDVSCFNRGLSGPCPDGVEVLKGDRNDRSSFKTAVAADTRDLIVDLTCYNRHDAEISADVFRGTGHYVHCSSVATYGRHLTRIPTTEDDLLLPENDYGKGKLESDNYLLSKFYDENLPVTIVKPSISYGPRMGLLRQIGLDLIWLTRIQSGLPILVVGDGIALHQFLHVTDVARAILTLAFKSETVGTTFNIVPPEPISWIDYHKTAMQILGRQVEMIGISAPLLREECSKQGYSPTDIFAHNSVFSGEKLFRVNGFYPSLSLFEGMAQVIEELIANDKLPVLASGRWEDEIIAKYSSSIVG
jgi:nucleoside-diphosphate-sugar epimerase